MVCELENQHNLEDERKAAMERGSGAFILAANFQAEKAALANMVLSPRSAAMFEHDRMSHIVRP